MAIQAETHAQRLGMAYLRHPIHPAVTGNTAHPAIHMNRMVEIYVVRCLVNLHP
jgi:hypothetical protein